MRIRKNGLKIQKNGLTNQVCHDAILSGLSICQFILHQNLTSIVKACSPLNSRADLSFQRLQNAWISLSHLLNSQYWSTSSRAAWSRPLVTPSISWNWELKHKHTNIKGPTDMYQIKSEIE